MIRTVRQWLVGVAVAGGGVAAAQSFTSPAALAGGTPPPATARPAESTPARAQAPAPADPEVLVMRTAGQPDRKIRVLKVSQYADGQSMADVQDVESGQKFTVPAKIVAALKRSAAGGTQPLPPAALPAAALPPQGGAKPIPFTPQPVQQAAAFQPVPMPPVAPRPDPLLTKMPPVAATPLSAPATPASASAWRSVNDPPAAAPRPVTPQPMPAPAPAANTKRDLWNAVGTPPTPVVAPQPTAPTAPAAPQTVPSPTAPGFAPTLPPATPPQSPTEPVIRGQAPEPTYGYRRLQFRPVSNWEPPARGFPARPAEVPVRQPDAPRVREEREPLGQAGFAFPARRTTLEQQLMEDTKQAVFDLYTAVRPSLREDAASVLAGGRFGSRPEVKQVLAKAALADPAAGVRAHCIRLLAELGYHDSEYVSYLRECSATGHPAVQTAATAALAKLAPRR